MNQRTLTALAEALSPRLNDAFVAGIKPLVERIAALEAREPEKGADGLNGKDGADGLNGRDGADGRDGIDGKDGAPGRDGIDGKDGVPGLNGKDGADGRDGAPGPTGAPGRNGEDGLNGKDGAPGLDGKDAPAPTIEQITEAVSKFDVDALIRDALLGADNGGIDVLAPDDVTQEMRSAVTLLAEPLPAKAAATPVAMGVAPHPKARSFRFDRDAQNRIIAAHEEFEDVK